MRLRTRTAGPDPLEQAEPTMAAIRQAEEAAAARLTAQRADLSETEAARRRAEKLVAGAALRAQELAGQRREAIRAEYDAKIQREQAVAEAKTAQIVRAARDGHDRAVRLAVTFVLTGETTPCSSR